MCLPKNKQPCQCSDGTDQIQILRREHARIDREIEASQRETIRLRDILRHHFLWGGFGGFMK